MAVQEWTTRQADRERWGAGPWDAEPDKVQWVDEVTGLDCLIVRGPLGSWCGYVGVPEGHPFFGIDYSRCTQTPGCGESYCNHTPEHIASVHGGLTYADFCQEPTREAFEHWCASMHARRQEARQYPRGDAARAWADRGHLVGDYEAWRKHGEASAICHLPLPGRPDRVWWFGFDCAHSGDLTPGLLEHVSRGARGDIYRDRAYVEDQVRQLAAQLHAIRNEG